MSAYIEGILIDRSCSNKEMIVACSQPVYKLVARYSKARLTLYSSEYETAWSMQKLTSNQRKMHDLQSPPDCLGCQVRPAAQNWGACPIALQIDVRPHQPTLCHWKHDLGMALFGWSSGLHHDCACCALICGRFLGTLTVSYLLQQT